LNPTHPTNLVTIGPVALEKMKMQKKFTDREMDDGQSEKLEISGELRISPAP
jgi:hypothetical protein